MNTTPLTTEALVAKARKVLQRMNELKEKSRKQEEELALLKNELEKQRKQIEALTDELKLTRLGAYLAGASREERAELKRKLNEMIQTVDLCIARLSEENQ